MNVQDTNVRNPNDPNVTGAQVNPQTPQYHYVYGVPYSPWTNVPFMNFYPMPITMGTPYYVPPTFYGRGYQDWSVPTWATGYNPIHSSQMNIPYQTPQTTWMRQPYIPSYSYTQPYIPTYSYTQPHIPTYSYTQPHIPNYNYTQTYGSWNWPTTNYQVPYAPTQTTLQSFVDPGRTINPQLFNTQYTTPTPQATTFNPTFYHYPVAPQLFNWTGWNPATTTDPLNPTRIPIT